MNTRIGILLLVMAGLLFYVHVFAQTGHADLDQLLQGKKVVAEGMCAMKSPTELAKGEEEPAQAAQCIIGQDPREPGKNYVGLVDGKGYYLIIRIDAVKKSQEVVWKRPGLQV